MDEPLARILLVDDDIRLRDLLLRYLESQGFEVKGVGDGTQMQQALDRGHYDLIVLDLMLPGEDGLEICRRLRGQGDPTPIVMLTAKGDEIDRIVGLEIGADDYLPKPVNPRELLARIRSVLRRSGERPAARMPERSFLRFSGWRLDAVARQLYDPDNVIINLSDGEFRLLLALVERPRRVLTRDMLLDLSRGPMSEHFDRAIDVQMSRLRKKLARPGREELIRTIRNEGYMFVAEVTTR